MTARRVALLAASGALLYGGAIALVATSDHATSVLVIPIAAGLSFTAAGIVAIARRPDNRTGMLMLGVGFFWAFGSLTLTNSSLLFTLGAIFQQVAFGPLANLLLAYPTGVLESRYHRRLVRATWAIVFLGPLLIALFERQLTNCDECPGSAFVVWQSHTLGLAGRIGYTAAAIGLATAALIELIRRYHGAGPPLRRTLSPVYAMFFLALVFLIAGNVVGAVSDRASTALGRVAVVFIALVPIAFLIGLLRGRLAQGSVVQLLMALDEGVPLNDALSAALGDPSLEIAYWLDSRDRWVDADGRGVAEPVSHGGRSVTTVERHGERVAALSHDASLDDVPDLVNGVAAAAALSLQTQRLQADLRNQYEFLETLVNTAPSLFVNIAVDGRILNQNLAVLTASGHENEDQIRGRYFWDVFMEPDEREAMQGRFAAAAPDFAGAQYENTFTNQRGERIVIDWRSAPVSDESGRVTSIIAGGIDITERKRQELELRASEERVRAVIESSPVATVEVDLDDRVATWNPAAEQIFGWTAEEVAGKPVPVISPARREESQELNKALRSGSVVSRFETTRLRKDGKEIDVEVSAAPVRDALGQVVGLMGLYMDVTDRKVRESQLQRERDITETLMQAIPSLVVVVDGEAIVVDSGVDETRAGVNDAFRHALGWPDTALVHRSVLELIDDEDSYLARMAIASAANGVASPERESRWLRADGDGLVIAWTATPIADVTGRKASLVLLSGIDVTERKRQEEEVRASRARIVQTADETRRKLERNLHDGAQQRLVALSVSLRLAETKLESDPDSAAAILSGARDELAHALEELRELARGIHPAVLTDRGLAAAIEALVTRTPLPVEVELPEDRLPPAVEAALYYVVSESLANVVKYADATSARVRVEIDGEGTVTAEVGDDGIGGADPERGSGLRGLADRVEALDGRLTVESPVGGGTRVRVEVPIPG